jgi:hypothetical protein
MEKKQLNYAQVRTIPLHVLNSEKLVALLDDNTSTLLRVVL